MPLIGCQNELSTVFFRKIKSISEGKMSRKIEEKEKQKKPEKWRPKGGNPHRR